MSGILRTYRPLPRCLAVLLLVFFSLSMLGQFFHSHHMHSGAGLGEAFSYPPAVIDVAADFGHGEHEHPASPAEERQHQYEHQKSWKSLRLKPSKAIALELPAAGLFASTLLPSPVFLKAVPPGGQHLLLCAAVLRLPVIRGPPCQG